ncbi:MAG TPA: fumarylacetoacetate hydrolase family protein [Magnetospirillaceae bacterium]|jgi:2-keto-4-pentenoate hydratase
MAAKPKAKAEATKKPATKKASAGADAKTIKDVADKLFAAAQSGQAIPPVRDLLPERDVDAAYRVQEINTKRALAAGRRLVGRKIGLTAKVVQKQLGVDEPDFGMLFADMALADGEEVARGRLIAPKVEAEVAFVMGKDITTEQPTIADILRAVDFVIPSIEIVDSRIADWKISIVDTVADNASAGLFTLGCEPKLLRKLDLRHCGMVIESKGEPICVGAGAAAMGNPVVAMLWLARTMARVGRPLKAGDVVMSGSLGPMTPVAWGDVVEARISGLGSVRAVFAKE